MTLEMMHADEGHLEAEGKRLAVHQADEQCSHQPRSRRHGDRVDLFQRDACLGERLVNHRDDGDEMGPARQFGDNAAEDAMHIL